MSLGGVPHLCDFLVGNSHREVFLISCHHCSPYAGHDRRCVANEVVISSRTSEPERLDHHLPACAPPSTCNTSPEVNVASVRNKAASTISLTSPILPTGCNPLRKSWVSGLCIGVLITPGATVFTRMPCFAYSMARARVTAFKAPFSMI